MTELVTLTGDRLTVTISPLGAELQSIRDADGREWLWDGDPAWWTGRSPLLFPVAGTLAGDTLRLDGETFPMAKHGFARRSMFEVASAEAASALLRLADSPATRAGYPFAFVLDVDYRVAGMALDIAATLHNPGAEPLPASFGFHPALRWPLPGEADRAAHEVRFAAAEPAPIRRIDATGLLTPVGHPTPVMGDRLALEDALFVEDALIFDALSSRSLRYGVPGGAGVEVDFQGMPQLGIWTKPGAPYLCIEPWQGFSDPEGFSGDYRDKPSVIAVPPGGSHRFAMRMRFDAGTPPEA